MANANLIYAPYKLYLQHGQRISEALFRIFCKLHVYGTYTLIQSQSLLYPLTAWSSKHRYCNQSNITFIFLITVAYITISQTMPL